MRTFHAVLNGVVMEVIEASSLNNYVIQRAEWYGEDVKIVEIFPDQDK